MWLIVGICASSRPTVCMFSTTTQPPHPTPRETEVGSWSLLCILFLLKGGGFLEGDAVESCWAALEHIGNPGCVCVCVCSYHLCSCM